MMNVVSLDPLCDPRWKALVDQQKSSVFHSPAWLQVLAESYGLEIAAHVLLDDAGQPVAGCPFCRHVDIKGKRIVTMPFSDYCDPLVGCRAEWDSLMELFVAEKCPLLIRCVHNNVPLEDARLTQVNRAKWHGLDLRPDLESLWHHLPESARRAIRKAEQSGVTVQPATCQDELRAFFKLHLGVRKHKYHMLAQPYSFFESIWRHFMAQRSGVLMLAIHAGEVIGSVLFLEWNQGLYYKFNASAPNDLGLRPNDLLIWKGIEYAKAQGYHHLDFGLSDWDQEGLIRFKRKFATEEKTISFLRYGEQWAQPAHAQQFQSLLPQLTDLFTGSQVSDDVTEKAGDILYRYFM